MFVRNLSGSMLALVMAIATVLPSEKASAQVQMYNPSNYGTGQWGAQQGCSTRTTLGTNAVSMSAEEKEKRKDIERMEVEKKKYSLQKERADKYMEMLSKKINRYFDSDIAEFLLETHFEGAKFCSDYKTYPEYNCPAPKEKHKKSDSKESSTGTVGSAPATAEGELTEEQKNVCKHKASVPAKLVPNWSKGEEYCTADSDDKKSRGSVSPAICNDESLRPDDRKAGSTSSCASDLKEYRRRKIESENAQVAIERAEDRIESLQIEISDAQSLAEINRKYKQEQTQGDCPTCDAEARGSANKSYAASLLQVGAGLTLGFIGKRTDETNREYQAQLGFQPTQGYPTAISMGFPLVAAGLYGAVTGGTAIGGFGCAGGINGTGAGNGYANGYGNAYGPYANQGGALGYPQNYYGAPWGGGAYMPGYNPYGNFNGPNGGLNGGLNGQFGVGSPLNGLLGNQMANNPLLGGQFGLNGNGQIGIPANGFQGANFQGGAGYPQAGYQMNNGLLNGGLNGGLNGQLGYGNYMNNGWNPNGMLNGGLNGGLNGQLGLNGPMNNPQYQMQLLQQQQAMLQQQQQQAQQQYYQAQVQAQNQMMAYQRQMQVTQQASAIQQEIVSLQQRLSMLNSTAAYGQTGILGGANGYYGAGAGGLINGSFSLGGSLNVNGGYNTGFTGYNSNLPVINNGTTATVPGTGTTTRGR